MTGGEDALQMSEMPELAEVSLSTLYRYFPSKEHLLFAVVRQHLESALDKTHPSSRGGATARERAASHLLRAFAFDQRVPTLSGLVWRLSALSDPAFRTERERLGRLHVEILRKAAGPLSEYQEQVLGVVLEAYSGAAQTWLAGLTRPGEVRFAIHTACRLLDLSPDVVAADRRAADAGKP